MMPRGKPKKAGPQALTKKLPAPNKKYYVSRDGQTQGPFTQVAVAQQVQTGALQGAFIAADGEQGWVEVVKHIDYRLIHEAAMTPDYDEWIAAPRLKRHFPFLMLLGLGALGLSLLAGLFTLHGFSSLSSAQRALTRAEAREASGRTTYSYYSTVAGAESRVGDAQVQVALGGASLCFLPLMAIAFMGADRWLAKKVKVANVAIRAELAAGEAALEAVEVGSPLMTDAGPGPPAPSPGQPSA